MTRSAAQPAPAVTPPERWGVWHAKRRRWVDGGAGIGVHTRAEAEAIARDGSRCTPGLYVAGDLDAGPPDVVYLFREFVKAASANGRTIGFNCWLMDAGREVVRRWDGGGA